MRKIIVSNLVSVDGFFEAPGQSLDWFVTNEQFFDYAVSMLDDVDTILYGRTTYQQMASFWPSEQADGLPAIKQRMNSLHKVVFSHTLEKAGWNNSVVASGNLEEEIKSLKEQPGKDMVIFGSGQIVSALTQMRLIDEYRMIVNPLLLGAGTPMFKGLQNRLSLHLKDTRQFSNSTIVLYYTLA